MKKYFPFFVWNAPLSKSVLLQEAHGSRDLRFFGITISWFGIGIIAGVKK